MPGTAPAGWQTPKTNWSSDNPITTADLNRFEGNPNAIETGIRTIDPSQAPTSNQGSLRNFLDWLANRIKAITGKTNWYDAPDTTLAAAKGHIDAAAPHSGHETPSGAQAKVDAHAAGTSVHGATSAATSNRLMMRDANGRAKVAAPAASDDIARKDTIDSKFDPNTGHKHTGAAGDGPKLQFESLDLSSYVFGDGLDGDVTITSNINLSRDMFYRNLTVNPGVSLNTQGYRVFVQGTLTLNGTVHNNGANGQNWGSEGQGSGGAGGRTGYAYGGSAGGTSSGSYPVYCSIGGQGGQGGRKDQLPGNVFRPADTTSLSRHIHSLVSLIWPSPYENINKGQLAMVLGGGTGGAPGAGGSLIGTSSGGGGGGGGVVAIYAYNLVNNGSIEAKGGNGGNASGQPANYGGGGGGGGGIILVYHTKSGSGTLSVAGGSGGTGSSGNGSPGSPGMIIEHQF